MNKHRVRWTPAQESIPDALFPSKSQADESSKNQVLPQDGAEGILPTFEVELGLLIPDGCKHVCLLGPGRHAGEVGQVRPGRAANTWPLPGEPGIARSSHLSKEAQIRMFIRNLLFCK